MSALWGPQGVPDNPFERTGFERFLGQRQLTSIPAALPPKGHSIERKKTESVGTFLFPKGLSLDDMEYFHIFLSVKILKKELKAQTIPIRAMAGLYGEKASLQLVFSTGHMY